MSNTMNNRKQAQRVADEAYEAGKPIMSDEVYDATFGDASTHHELTGQTAELPLWMGSLDKKRDEKALDAWLDKTTANYFVVSAKLDGISALYDPACNKLYTRGNGHTGCDISRFIKYLNLKEAEKVGSETLKVLLEATSQYESWTQSPEKAYVRGELIMANSVFQEKYSNKFKNPRNLVSGQFAKKTINKDIMGDIFFVPYEVTVSGAPSQCPASEQLHYSFMLPWVEMNRVDMSVGALGEILDQWAKDCVFDMDGLVVSENRMYTRNTSGNPKYSIAFKKETGTESSAVATVSEIVWDVSRWGLLKPVVHIEAVKLSGVTIKKCSGHNAKYILDHKIGPGAQVVCVRSGDVIPHIVSVVKTSEVKLPSSTWKGVDLCAEGAGADDTMEIKTLTNIFSKLDVKHVSTKTIEKMYGECELNTFPKMLNCKKTELQPVFKDKSADRIINGMNDLKSRSVKLSVLVGSAGLLGYGMGAKRVESLFANLPSLRYGDWETVPRVEDVCGIEGFGKNTAEKVVQCFPKMTSFLKMCTDSGLQIGDEEQHSVNEQSPKSAAKQNVKSAAKKSVNEQNVKSAAKHKICLSGFRNKELEQKYDVLSSVTKQCEILVCKSFEKETGKMMKAKKMGVRMVLLDEFINEYSL